MNEKGNRAMHKGSPSAWQMLVLESGTPFLQLKTSNSTWVHRKHKMVGVTVGKKGLLKPANTTEFCQKPSTFPNMQQQTEQF